MDGETFEALYLAPVYRDLQRHYATPDPDIDPRDLAGRLRFAGDRAVALLYAYQHCDTWEECEALLALLLDMMDLGQRPLGWGEFGD